MRSMVVGLVAMASLVPLCARPPGAEAQTAPAPDKYHVTSAEKAACTQDAMRLCLATYPSEERLLGCMKTNVNELTPTCRVVFVAGMKRRGLR